MSSAMGWTALGRDSLLLPSLLKRARLSHRDRRKAAPQPAHVLAASHDWRPIWLRL